jgi:FtsH-binding integral membrane protein
VDEGLRAYMLRVYNYMTLGLAITGAVALGTFMAAVAVDPGTGARSLTQIGQLLYASPLKWVVIFAPLALVFFLSFRIDRLSVGAAQALFWIYAALVGLSLSVIFLVFTGQSITRVFFITAASFGALSLYGYTTQRDLSGFGSFLLMGLVGIIIASLVNIFLASSMLQWIVSVVGVLVFAGLTAYDTQQIKEMYYVGDDGTVAGRKAVMGALRLYLDFINLFTMLLQLFGQREE